MIVNTIQPSGGTKPTSQMITLAKNNWGLADAEGIMEVKSNEQYIDVSGLSTNEGSQLIHVVPISGSESSYREYGITCSGPLTDHPGKLRFTYTGSSAPTDDLRVYVVMEDLKVIGGSARLSDLKIGALALTPAFDPNITDYTATTSNSEDIVTATPEYSGATVKIETDNGVIENGTTARWNSGANKLTITVTAGNKTMTYNVTVEYAGT